MARDDSWQSEPPPEPPPCRGRDFSAEEQVFLDAIHLDIDKSRPLKAYAEWLQERNDPLGRFIYLQCRHGAIMPNKDNSAWNLYRRRNREECALLRANWEKWVWSLNEKLYLRLADFQWGLARRVLVRVDDRAVLSWLESATPKSYDQFISEVSPLLRFALPVFDTPELPELLRHPLMARVDSLSVDGVGREPGRTGGVAPGGGVSTAAIEAVEACPYLQRFHDVHILGLASEAKEAYERLSRKARVERHF